MIVRADNVRASSRLAQSCTLRGGGLEWWRQATVFIAGAGTIGQRVAIETVLSGARVVVCDPDVFTAANAETQIGTADVSKIDSLLQRANTIAPGRVTGFSCDVRHVGIGEISKVQVLIDCTDDAGLALPLARISNGLSIPLLRAAVDGSGQREMGRVACSHGGNGYSCQVCSYRLVDLLARTPRTPCPGAALPQHTPTFAGGALASIIAGAAVLQAQRLVTGNDVDRVLGRELILDMTNTQMISVHRPRCADCLSGHVHWVLTRISRQAKKTKLADFIEEAGERLGSDSITLEPYGHALCTAAICSCGWHQPAVGTRWSAAPRCSVCGGLMAWACETARDRFTLEDTREFGADGMTLWELGLPDRGAMFVARTAGRRPLRLVLE